MPMLNLLHIGPLKSQTRRCVCAVHVLYMAVPALSECAFLPVKQWTITGSGHIMNQLSSFIFILSYFQAMQRLLPQRLGIKWICVGRRRCPRRPLLFFFFRCFFCIPRACHFHNVQSNLYYICVNKVDNFVHWRATEREIIERVELVYRCIYINIYGSWMGSMRQLSTNK